MGKYKSHEQFPLIRENGSRVGIPKGTFYRDISSLYASVLIFLLHWDTSYILIQQEMQISKIIKATITKKFMYQSFFPIGSRWWYKLCMLGLLVLGKCSLSNYLEPQNAKWQSLVLTQYCYFNLLELAQREEGVNKIVCVHTTYHVKPQNIFFDLDHIQWKVSKPSLSLESKPGTINCLGLLSFVLCWIKSQSWQSSVWRRDRQRHHYRLSTFTALSKEAEKRSREFLLF